MPRSAQNFICSNDGHWPKQGQWSRYPDVPPAFFPGQDSRERRSCKSHRPFCPSSQRRKQPSQAFDFPAVSDSICEYVRGSCLIIAIFTGFMIDSIQKTTGLLSAADSTMASAYFSRRRCIIPFFDKLRLHQNRKGSANDPDLLIGGVRTILYLRLYRCRDRYQSTYKSNFAALAYPRRGQRPRRGGR